MIDRQPFGRTGHWSTRTILGGAAFWRTTQDESDATLDLALGCGVNHVDTAADYGESERRIGSWIQRHGKAFFLSTNTGGGADTPSCTSCHTSNPVNAGQTRAGKAIEPMAVSASPGRFTDFAKTEKWFTRNCKTVLGRECTPQEKGDFITYMTGL